MTLKPPGDETGVLCVREVPIKTSTCSYPGTSFPLRLPVHTILLWCGMVGLEVLALGTERLYEHITIRKCRGFRAFLAGK
jgi:hypothetical protein